MSSEDLRKESPEIMDVYEGISQEIDVGRTRMEKLLQFAENTPEYLAELDRQFEEKTKLSEDEFLIMGTVIGLQLLRQYFLTKFSERLNDQDAARQTPGHGEEHSDRNQGWYNPTLDEIIHCPVPFDANVGADGRLSGGGSMGHRVKTLGHDPLLGLVVGTANIATSTLTTCEWESYHIRTYNKRDIFAENARTHLVLSKTFDKLFNEGMEGKKKVGAAFVKEIIHLQSDANTKKSLPLPFISVIDPKFASKLAEYGFDFANVITVVKQVEYARLINSLAAMYHYSFYDGTIPEELYRVKTKKIICYANAVASATNMAAVCKTEKWEYLDIGGIANTIFELVTSVEFMRKVKIDFIFGTYDAALASI